MHRWLYALGALLLPLHAHAAPQARSLEVAPTTLELASGEPGLLYVTNQSATAVTVQIDIYDWTQSRDGDHLALSDNAFVSPPLATIAPGARQTVRVLAQPADSAHESAYRLRVSELPDPMQPSDGVRVLLQFSIPVFARGEKDGSALIWSASAKGGSLELRAENAGGRTAKLGGLRVSFGAGAALPVAPDRVTYILPGASHVWTMPAARFAQASTVHVEAMDERAAKPVSADASVAR